MFNNKQQVEAALQQLGRRLASADAGEHALLVCGGSALSLGELVARATRDVDVLGLVKGHGRTEVSAEGLPRELVVASEGVAKDLGLPLDWLSDAAREVQRLGLPSGILGRARRKRFGPCLQVFVLGRKDQVALKLYAALDTRGGQRHFRDLELLVPTCAELESAAKWLLDRKTSPSFRAAVRRLVRVLTPKPRRGRPGLGG